VHGLRDGESVIVVQPRSSGKVAKTFANRVLHQWRGDYEMKDYLWKTKFALMLIVMCSAVSSPDDAMKSAGVLARLDDVTRQP